MPCVCNFVLSTCYNSQDLGSNRCWEVWQSYLHLVQYVIQIINIIHIWQPQMTFYQKNDGNGPYRSGQIKRKCFATESCSPQLQLFPIANLMNWNFMRCPSLSVQFWCFFLLQLLLRLRRKVFNANKITTLADISTWEKKLFHVYKPWGVAHALKHQHAWFQKDLIQICCFTSIIEWIQGPRN